jgi:hypothetical protein
MAELRILASYGSMRFMPCLALQVIGFVMPIGLRRKPLDFRQKPIITSRVSEFGRSKPMAKAAVTPRSILHCLA